MTEMSSRPIRRRVVYAQDTQPDDERDGVIWVDTSVSPRKNYVYSSDSGTWEALVPDSTKQNSNGTLAGWLLEHPSEPVDWWDDDHGTAVAQQLTNTKTYSFTDPVFQTFEVDAVRFYLEYTDTEDVTLDEVGFYDSTGSKNVLATPNKTGNSFSWNSGTLNFSQQVIDGFYHTWTHGTADFTSGNVETEEIHCHAIQAPAHDHLL